MHAESHASRGGALKREAEIKSLSRARKFAIFKTGK
jgi:predicted GIY-YIG superfamily endonuclease